MSDPTNSEQYMLEIVNRFRMDPQGELPLLLNSPDPDIRSALSFFEVDLGLLRNQWSGLTPVAPLAWSTSLNDAASSHNGWMIDRQAQAHEFAGEPGLAARLFAAEPGARLVAENIFAFSSSVDHAHAGFLIDWGEGTGGIQDGYGHRVNLSNADLTEVGIAITAATGRVGPLVVTQDFAATGDRYVLGVVYDDLDGDLFYDPGEGLADVSIQIGSQTVRSTASGGWQAAVAPGTYGVTFSGASIAAPYSQTVTVGAQSVKLDLEMSQSGELIAGGVDADRLSGGGGGDTMRGGAGADLIYGNQDADLVYGNAGADTLFGGQGVDVLFGGQDADRVYGNLSADLAYGNLGDDDLFGGQGSDSLFGGQGDDRLYGNLDDDILNGNLGDDTLVGGAGADLFVLRGNGGADVIADFDFGEGDRIALAAGQGYTVGTGAGGAAVLDVGDSTVTLLGIVPAFVGDALFVVG